MDVNEQKKMVEILERIEARALDQESSFVDLAKIARAQQNALERLLEEKATVEAARDRAREAILRFGRHWLTCDLIRNPGDGDKKPPCTCGFAEIAEEAKNGKTDD